MQLHLEALHFTTVPRCFNNENANCKFICVLGRDSKLSEKWGGGVGRVKPEDFKLPVKLAQLEADLMMPISIN